MLFRSVAHHVHSKIPHYHAWEATDALRVRLGEAGIRLQGKNSGWSEMWRIYKQCKVRFISRFECFHLPTTRHAFIPTKANLCIYFSSSSRPRETSCSTRTLKEWQPPDLNRSGSVSTTGRIREWIFPRRICEFPISIPLRFWDPRKRRNRSMYSSASCWMGWGVLCLGLPCLSEDPRTSRVPLGVGVDSRDLGRPVLFT